VCRPGSIVARPNAVSVTRRPARCAMARIPAIRSWRA
jgi:hypothetical protein